MADDNHPLDTPAAGRDMPADPQRRHPPLQRRHF